MKKILLIIAVVAFIAACKNNLPGTKVSLAEFPSKAKELVGKEVILEGTISHVCHMNYQKMFLVGENPDQEVKIVTGKEIAKFDTTLQNTKVLIQGVVMLEEASMPEQNKTDSLEAKRHEAQYAVECKKIIKK